MSKIKVPVDSKKTDKKSVFSKLQIIENPNLAFENAIKRGMKDPENWMYMYSENGHDYFKNSITRQYISYSHRGIKKPKKQIRKNMERGR